MEFIIIRRFQRVFVHQKSEELYKHMSVGLAIGWQSIILPLHQAMGILESTIRIHMSLFCKCCCKWASEAE